LYFRCACCCHARRWSVSKRVEICPKVGSVSLTIEQNSLRAHRGLRAMILPVLRLQSQLNRPSWLYLKNREGRKGSHGGHGGHGGVQTVVQCLWTLLPQKEWPPCPFHSARCCHASTLAARERVEMIHRSEVHPGPPTKTPSVPTVASVR
jgi:hypothetical protein